jgi:hypothetical protein
MELEVARIGVPVTIHNIAVGIDVDPTKVRLIIIDKLFLVAFPQGNGVETMYSYRQLRTCLMTAA